MVTGIFTKLLPKIKHEKFIEILMKSSVGAMECECLVSPSITDIEQKNKL